MHTKSSPLLPLFQPGKPLTYNQIVRAWPLSESYNRHVSVYDELKACVEVGLLSEGKRGNWGTWKLTK